MDWFDQDNNLLIPDEQDSFSNTNVLDIENIFMNKQNSFTDFEMKMEDFLIGGKSEQINSKLPQVNESNSFTVKEDKTANKSIFSITKEKKKEENKRENQIKSKKLSKEELAHHPFIKEETRIPSSANTNYAYSPNYIISSENSELLTKKERISDYHNNYVPSTTSLEDHSEIKTDSYRNEKSKNNDDSEDYSFSNGNCDSLINNNSVLDEEEAKYNLFNKLNANYGMANSNKFNNNSDNFLFNSAKDFNNNNSANFLNNTFCNGSEPCPYSMYVPLQSLPLSERMKIKKEKTKLLLEKKTKREDLPFNNIYNTNYKENVLNTTTSSNLENILKPQHETTSYCPANMTKKEVKILRNRVSAQRSRDRKKKELDDLKVISQNLLNETCMLRKQVETRDRELREIKDQIKRLCGGCQTIMKENNRKSLTDSITNDNMRPFNIVDASARRFSNSLKYSLMAGFLVVVCLLGTLTISKNETTNERFTGRVLTSYNTTQNKVDVITPKEKGLILYTPNETKGNIVNSGSSALNYPFAIVKDLDKYVKKQLNKNKDLSSSANRSYLNKKRMHFITNLNSRKKQKYEETTELGFLSGKRKEVEGLCPNTNYLSLSVQQEEPENEIIDLSEREYTDDHEEVDNGEKENQIKIKNENYESNGVVPVTSRNNQQHSLIDNIHSLYCKDFITSAKENSKLFQTLFNKVNMQMKTEGFPESEHIKIEKSDSDKDCLYLHMIVPEDNESSKIINNLDFKPEETNFIKVDQNVNLGNESHPSDSKKVYYELGCKIFEINKIFK